MALALMHSAGVNQMVGLHHPHGLRLWRLGRKGLLFGITGGAL